MKKILPPASGSVQNLSAVVTQPEGQLHLPTMGDFPTLYALYWDPIYRYCLNKSRDREVSLDLAQETFLRFWVCLQRKEDIRHARGFLYRIAHNLFLSHIRKKKEASLDCLLETGFEPSSDPWSQIYSHLDAAKPLKKLRKMPKPYQEVLRQRFILGLTPAAISKLTGETSNVISVRTYRGLRDLRVLLATHD